MMSIAQPESRGGQNMRERRPVSAVSLAYVRRRRDSFNELFVCTRDTVETEILYHGLTP